MFVKSLLVVALFNTYAFAQTEDFKDFVGRQRKYFAEIRKEAKELDTLSPSEAKAALQRGKQQIIAAQAAYDKAIETWGKKGKEFDFYYLDDAIIIEEETLSQHIAMSVGLWVLKAQIAQLEKEGKIADAKVSWTPRPLSKTHGDFHYFPGDNNSGYETKNGLLTRTRQLTVTYKDLVRHRSVTISATLGSHLHELVEVEKRLSAGSGFTDWVGLDFATNSGIVENAMTRFILKGAGLNFSETVKANGTKRLIEGLHTYYYGLIFIGPVKIQRE